MWFNVGYTEFWLLTTAVSFPTPCDCIYARTSLKIIWAKLETFNDFFLFFFFFFLREDLGFGPSLINTSSCASTDSMETSQLSCPWNVMLCLLSVARFAHVQSPARGEGQWCLFAGEAWAGYWVCCPRGTLLRWCIPSCKWRTLGLPLALWLCLCCQR